jgi:hypothetical protein
MYKITFILFAISLLTACSTRALKPAEFMKFINEEKNGLNKVKNINGLKIKVKYLPSDFLAYKEFKDSDMSGDEKLDSLKKLYANSLTFVMELSPEKEKSQDVMLQNIHSEQEYKDRVNVMNFNMKDYLEIEVDGKNISPSIANLENIYGLKNSRKVIVVFPVEIKKMTRGKELKFTYSDEIYSTGVNHFEFQSDDILDVPQIKI